MKNWLEKLYLYRFLDDFVLIYPTYVLLFQESGLDPQQITWLLMIWSATSLILEIPTGVLADKYSRKWLLVLAELIRMVGYAIWLVWRSFGGFALGFVLWGIKGALTSGTLDALVYDELKNNNQEERYEKVYGGLSATGFVGVALALVMGGYVSSLSYDLSLVLSMVTVIMAAVVMITIRQVKPTEVVEKEKSLRVLVNTLKQVRNTRRLRQIIIYAAVVLGIFGALDEMYPLLFKSLGLNLTGVGIFSALMFVGLILAGMTSKWVIAKMRTAPMILTMISGLCLVGVAGGMTFWRGLWIFPAAYLLGVSEIKLKTKMQQLTESGQRATVLSVYEMILELTVILFLPVLGWLVNQTGVISGVVVSGVMLVIVGGVGVVMLRTRWR